jgi:hypothetical protein
MLGKLVLVAAEADRSTFCALMMSRTSSISFEPCPSHNVLMSFCVLLINEIINKVFFELKKAYEMHKLRRRVQPKFVLPLNGKICQSQKNITI